MKFRMIIIATAAIFFSVCSSPVTAKTHVVMLGTGTPVADPDRSGPAIAVVVDGKPYLVDCGPGVVRRTTAAYRKGFLSLAAKNLTIVFITHLHSDHTLGYPDLIFSPWVLGRQQALSAYGPKGLKHMTDHIQQAWVEDRKVRTSGLEKLRSQGSDVRVFEIEPGKFYNKDKVQVEAISVQHGSWSQAFAYKFTTPDKVIVISGDTGPSEAIEKAALGCDILIHEVYLERPFKNGKHRLPDYHQQFHTSTSELAKLANSARPKLLVLYHILSWGLPENLLVEEIRAAGYQGKIIVAKDLDVF
jgi:ribonuclease BN (tRNA processing enzyme)